MKLWIVLIITVSAHIRICRSDQSTARIIRPSKASNGHESPSYQNGYQYGFNSNQNYPLDYSSDQNSRQYGYASGQAHQINPQSGYLVGQNGHSSGYSSGPNSDAYLSDSESSVEQVDEISDKNFDAPPVATATTGGLPFISYALRGIAWCQFYKQIYNCKSYEWTILV